VTDEDEDRVRDTFSLDLNTLAAAVAKRQR
jgi:hypothetical protein